LKEKQRAKSKIKNLHELTTEMEAKGIAVNKESLATRVKNPRRIGDLEDAQDRKAKEQLGLSDDSDSDDSVMDDADTRMKEGDERGRRGRGDERQDRKKLLKKRKPNTDIEMLSDDSGEGIEKNIRGSKGKSARKMTPSQRKISVQ